MSEICRPNDPDSAVTAIVPAYNEASSIAATVLSLQRQTYPPVEIIVVDDCSTDDTGAIARALGATVLRPRSNTGSKAGAQNYALPHVKTPLCMAIDADTEVAADAVEKLISPLISNSLIAATCGFVLPRNVKTMWERGRYIEYLFAFTFYKPIQDLVGRPMISSGCFSAYRTEALRGVGGWSDRTMAEDMDLTWTLYREGFGVRFIADALCYPIEPHNLHFMGKQLRRWSHGFIQNVRVHRHAVLEQPYLRSVLVVGLWDAVVASLAFLILVPLLAVLVHPLFLLGYVVDLPAVLVPVVAAGVRRRELGTVLASVPAFLVLRVTNAVYMLRALWLELVLNRPLLTYEKGH